MAEIWTDESFIDVNRDQEYVLEYIRDLHFYDNKPFSSPSSTRMLSLWWRSGMLLEFRIKGFRSILNEVSLSMMKEDGNTLPLALIYGANGSGKSSILSSFQDLKERVKGEKDVRYEPHRLSGGRISYLVYFSKNGNEYGYLVVYQKEKYEKEELYAKKDGKYELVASYENKDALLIPAGNSPSSQDLLSFFTDDLVVLSSEGDWISYSKHVMSGHPERRKKIVKAFKNLGFTIENIDVEDDDVYFDYGNFRVPLSDEAYGVRRLFAYLVALLDAIKEGKCVVSDELESHLHHIIVAQIVKEFASKSEGAQLILATHDIDLLSLPDVKKDEIWFTRLLGPERYTELYSLSEFDDTKDGMDFRKEYIEGLYGARPVVKGIFEEDL